MKPHFETRYNGVSKKVPHSYKSQCEQKRFVFRGWRGTKSHHRSPKLPDQKCGSAETQTNFSSPEIFSSFTLMNANFIVVEVSIHIGINLTSVPATRS